jgi:DNA-binding NarL/FixJ family response regulator
MNFYAVMVFLGSVLVAISLILVFLDKKKVFSFTSRFEDKKQELVGIINDAEEMIEELNKFSDYIVTQMDLKNEELRVNLRNAEEEIRELKLKAQSFGMSMAGSAAAEAKLEYRPAAVVNAGMPAADAIPVEIMPGQSGEPAAARMDFDSPAYKPAIRPTRQAPKKPEKVIPINNRYSEVLRLSESGLSELDIAKLLNMGKGEVGLILGINKN